MDQFYAATWSLFTLRLTTRYISVPDMKTGIVPGGVTRIPENANAGQKLYLNPANDAMMLCALVDEVTDTCLRFYRH